MNKISMKLAVVLTVLFCAFFSCEKAGAAEVINTNTEMKTKPTIMEATAATLQEIAGTWTVCAQGEKGEELTPNSWADMYCTISNDALEVYTIMQTYDPKDKTTDKVRQDIDSYPINWAEKDNRFNIDGTAAKISRDANGRLTIECGSFRMMMQRKK